MGRFQVSNESTMRVGYLTMDAAGRTGEGNPFTDVRVRRAVNHAIDREALVKALLRGQVESDQHRLLSEPVRLRSGREELRLRPGKG